MSLERYPVSRENIAKLGRALKKAADEHGRPNSFSPGELARLYGGPRATVCGRIGRDHDALMEAWITGMGGRAGFGSCPVYATDTKRFYV